MFLEQPTKEISNNVFEFDSATRQLLASCALHFFFK
jgi:hypothetical protein